MSNPTDNTPQSTEDRSGAESAPPQGPSPATTPPPWAAGFLERFSMPERLMLFGSGISFLLGFFNWYSISSTFMGKSYGGGVSGFNPWYGKLFFVTSLATVVLLAAPTLRQSLLGKKPVKTQTSRVRRPGGCKCTLRTALVLHGCGRRDQHLHGGRFRRSDDLVLAGPACGRRRSRGRHPVSQGGSGVLVTD